MVNGRLLRWGVFLLALGGLVLLGGAGTLDRELVRQALGLWPLAVIGFGAAILLRRTRFGLASGVVAAAMPGLLLGGLVVAIPEIGSHCRTSNPPEFFTRQGSFGETATVDLRIACGDLTVTTTPGRSWEARIGQTDRPAPVLAASSAGLTISMARQVTWFGPPGEGDVVEVALPTDSELDVTARVDAGDARVNLGSAHLGRAALVVSAGAADVDLTGSTLQALDLVINAGRGRIVLPLDDFNGEIEVNGGEIRICAPPGLGVRVREDVTFGSVVHGGLRAGRGTSTWESEAFATALHQFVCCLLSLPPYTMFIFVLLSTRVVFF
jgi:hypothetical protein